MHEKAFDWRVLLILQIGGQASFLTDSMHSLFHLFFTEKKTEKLVNKNGAKLTSGHFGKDSKPTTRKQVDQYLFYFNLAAIYSITFDTQHFK